MKNDKGMTVIEVVVSIALISIVLVFLMNLFLQVRYTYVQSRTETDYGTISSTFIKAIGDDIENYGLLSAEYKPGVNNYASVILTFKTYRPTKLSEHITKVLKVYEMGNKYYLSYGYDTSVMLNKNITSDERITNIVRELPTDAVLNTDRFISIDHTPNTSTIRAVKIQVPFENRDGNVYDINVSGLLEE